VGLKETISGFPKQHRVISIKGRVDYKMRNLNLNGVQTVLAFQYLARRRLVLRTYTAPQQLKQAFLSQNPWNSMEPRFRCYFSERKGSENYYQIYISNIRPAWVSSTDNSLTQAHISRKLDMSTAMRFLNSLNLENALESVG